MPSLYKRVLERIIIDIIPDEPCPINSISLYFSLYCSIYNFNFYKKKHKVKYLNKRIKLY